MAKKEFVEKKEFTEQKELASQKEKPQVGTYYSVEVKDGKATIDGVSVSTNVADGKYDVKVWSDGSVSFYYEGHIKNLRLT